MEYLARCNKINIIISSQGGVGMNKLLIVHLSDMHFENSLQTHSINIDKMIAALKSRLSANECVIVISGDLANKGNRRDYKYVRGFISALLRGLNGAGFEGKKINVLPVPGNHDIDFSSFTIELNDINKAYEAGTIEELEKKYLGNMDAFFLYAHEQECFRDDKVISTRIIEYGETKVGIVMCNTAPMSLLGGRAEDMGTHYLSDEELQKLEEATEADINILVLHHSMEWLKTNYKDKMRKIISKRYSLVLSGHEHSSYGESDIIDMAGVVQLIQGNALCGDAEEGNGFCALTIDLDNFESQGYSFIWKDFIYVPKKILDAKIRAHLSGDLVLLEEFWEQIIYDSYHRKIDDYYVFPGITYNELDENENIKPIDLDTEQELFDFIDNKRSVIIRGDRKAGKTLLAKRLFRHFWDAGKKPLLIETSEINKKKIEKTLDYIFPEEYTCDNYSYERYKQLNKSQKVAIIDEANLILPQTLNALVEFLERHVEQVIILSEEKIKLNVRKQVVDALAYEETITLQIKPFLYDKRKLLISNILRNSGKEYNIEKETTKINDLINMQVKYFDLDPAFIISFVNQYEMDINFKYTAGMNVFNVVYDSTIKNNIIANSNEVDPTHVINILRELAYKMHFEKKNSVKLEEISEVIDIYKKDYRQRVKATIFLDAVLSAKILYESDGEFRFKDHTIIAYFVAQALNQKYNQGEDIKRELNLLLTNLCFSINSDIVLFLALITDNPKFVNIIIEGAQKHFDGQEELSFDKKNIEYILDTDLPIKDSLPDKKERAQRECEISKQEESVKFTDLIEIVDEYDYTDEDLRKIENQAMISFKYLEILSKTLPAFCQNMKVPQQDRLVKLIYGCPNQFLYAMLKDIESDFDDFSSSLYEEISLLRREKNVTEISLQGVRRALEQISSVFIIALYQLVASTCTNEQSILALNEFDFKSNTNYCLQNLMMAARIDDINIFSRKAKDLDKRVENGLSKSIIKYTVRDYFMRNSNIDMHGNAQSLMDNFFGNTTKKEIKMDMAKKRKIENDRI